VAVRRREHGDIGALSLDAFLGFSTNKGTANGEVA